MPDDVRQFALEVISAETAAAAAMAHVVGEPFERAVRLIADSPGSLLATGIGKPGHVAYPRLVDNPVRRLAAVLDALHHPALDAGTPAFEPSNLEVVSVDVGNPATNVTPGEIRLVFNVRFNDLWTPKTLSAEIERRVAAAARGARCELTFDPTNAVAFLTPRGPFADLVARAVAETTGRSPKLSTGGGASDARFIKDVCPVAEFGLVGATAHAVDERVAVADLEALSRAYERVLELYFAGFAAG